MKTKNIFHIVLFLFFMLSMVLASNSAYCADKTFVQKIEWKSDSNVLEYKVEIVSLENGTSKFVTTDKTSAEVSLSPGKYRYRVFAYDFLGKEAGVSEWTSFEVFKANKPVISNIEKSVSLNDDDSQVSINVDISDVNSDTKYELISDSLKGLPDSVDSEKLDEGSEKGSIKKLNFKDVPPGKWRLRVTNASGLTSVSDVIEINGKAESKITEEDLQKIRDEAEAKFSEERKNFEDELKKLEKERENLEIEKKNLEEKRLELDEKNAERLRKEAEKKAKEEYKKAHPYIYKDFIFELGAGLTFSPYDGSIKEYTDSALAPALKFKIAYLPFKFERNKFGFEFGLSSQTFEGKMDLYDIKLDYRLFDLNALWHKKLSKKTFLVVRAGLGLESIEKNVEYSIVSNSRKEPQHETYWYPEFTSGVSLFFTPWKFLVFETGIDYNHIMATDMTTGFITPFACIGFRF